MFLYLGPFCTIVQDWMSLRKIGEESICAPNTQRHLGLETSL